MSTFTKYLTEATKTYEYKVKIAGDIDKDFASRMETACQKFELKKYILQRRIKKIWT